VYEVFVGNDTDGTQTVATFSSEEEAVKEVAEISKKIDEGKDIGHYTDIENPTFAKYDLGPENSKVFDVERHWETFERRVLAKDAPLVQRSEMRLAFVAGATALFYTMAKEFPCEEYFDLVVDEIEDRSRMYTKDVPEDVYIKEKRRNRHRG
jgi:hypothetical protein